MTLESQRLSHAQATCYRILLKKCNLARKDNNESALNTSDVSLYDSVAKSSTTASGIKKTVSPQALGKTISQAPSDYQHKSTYDLGRSGYREHRLDRDSNLVPRVSPASINVMMASLKLK